MSELLIPGGGLFTDSGSGDQLLIPGLGIVQEVVSAPPAPDDIFNPAQSLDRGFGAQHAAGLGGILQ